MLGFDVTNWWAERDGLNGLALELLQAVPPEDVRQRAAAKGSSIGRHLCVRRHMGEDLYKEFKEKGAFLAQDIITYPGGAQRKSSVRDPDGYEIARGVDGRPGGMRSPIQPAYRRGPRLGPRCRERYDRLLDLNVNPAEQFDGKLHTFKLENGTDLVLEADGADEAVTPPPNAAERKTGSFDCIDRLEA